MKRICNWSTTRGDLEGSRAFLRHRGSPHAANPHPTRAGASRGQAGRPEKQKLSLEEAGELPGHCAVELLALDDALEDLTKIYPRKSKVVELKFFGGMEAKQISEVLQVSEKTVLRDWNFARLWLSRELRKDAA